MRKKRPSGEPPTIRAEDSSRLREEVMRQIKAPHRPVLVVLGGREVGTRLVAERSLTIGRDPQADLTLRDAPVSWHHARLEDRGDGWALIDLDSTNGTSVNGIRGQEFFLRPNDRVMFGDTLVAFEMQDGIQQAYNEAVDKLLNVDDLSGLLVRRKFDAELVTLIERARHNHASVALLVMDLDGVKKINDEHGHLFGAYVIGESGRVIGGVVGARGLASRFGGDEFLAALPRLTVGDALLVGEEIRRAVSGHVYIKDGVRLRPGISIGVAAFPESADNAEQLFDCADQALYRAKRAGKDRVTH